MADFVVGIDYLLEGSDDSSSEELQPSPAAKPTVEQEQLTEKKQESELTGIELLRSMYKKDEEIIQRSRSYTADASHSGTHRQKIKVKLKVGTIVDIFSASKKQWLEGSITEIKGDTICILYGKRKKWLHKKSKNWRPKQETVQNALQPLRPQSARSQSVEASTSNLLPVSESPPAAFNAVYLDDDTMNINVVEIPRIMSHASPQHYEYDVTFMTQSLGLSLCAFKDGINCMVKQCVNAFSASSVDVGSLVASVNGKNVFGLKYTQIRDILRNNAMVPPLTVTFRAKMDEKNFAQENNVNERGLLQLKVVSCVELKHAASYVSIQVGKACLTTKQLNKNNHHPEWNESLSFKNFRCDLGKKGIVSVYAKSAVLKNKKVGFVEYTLPVKFNQLKKETLELKTDKGKISGILNLNAIVVPQR